ncbi:IS3 family transposase [Bradyrhizobium sp. 26S5]|nr:IS3 family transposase [Bradyrhizobium sp. 2S1]MCK7664837.1 IS3 family transposase [Bradyrhizobium sp. 2S1]MCK7669373.1 IS3 family transposase [Bradyrhizobium sp. 2S1]MCK7673024.1 IS3 family transposase [Bradyrhizobium sp. 2S1]MCK7673748.1 IS3 family transposase [Bradyrhizobium sp. 2S1]
MEGRQRRSFTDDYKRQAVDLVASSGRSIGSVAKELGLRDSVLRRWVELRGTGREPTAAARRPTTQATLPSADHAAEIARLQRENERLRMERDILKKSIANLCWGAEMRFRFIEDRRADYPVTILCDVLGVSPAGYYAWRSRPESQRSVANRELVDDIKRVHRETNGRYGSPRIHVELKAQGRGASRGRIERLMRHHGIRAIMARPRRVRTTDSRHDLPIAANLLERNFTATAPNRIWLADITYIETDQGWLYLATVMDLYSRRIVGWAMADHLRAELPLAALRMAVSAQRPGAGLIHHSDRGVQYASAEYRKVVQSAGLRASMSRKADCYDNAPMESFFHTLKIELVYHTHYATRAEATRDIFAYIEGFYNRTRRHSAIGYVSPIEMELKAA